MSNIFISHRLSDTAEAERLSIELKKQGHSVWLDEWELKVGDSIVEQMESGLSGATYLVLCMSSSGVKSSWMGREWMSTLARQLNGQGVKIIPAILTGGDPPAIIADLKYADLVSDWRKGVAEIIAAVK